jgi:hypothetical protein
MEVDPASLPRRSRHNILTGNAYTRATDLFESEHPESEFQPKE